MLLVITETNHGLAYDRDVKVSFETFYEVIFVVMLNSETAHFRLPSVAQKRRVLKLPIKSHITSPGA